MITDIAWMVCFIFSLLALWHFYMAVVPVSGESIAIPSVDGRPLFVPSMPATFAVGFVLILFAGLVAATAGLLPTGLPDVVLSWVSYALALGLLVRAIGEFHYVGFFKRIRGSKFATYDTYLYSPLCLLLSGGVLLVAQGS